MPGYAEVSPGWQSALVGLPCAREGTYPAAPDGGHPFEDLLSGDYFRGVRGKPSYTRRYMARQKD